jgi:hypothetical protein
MSDGNLTFDKLQETVKELKAKFPEPVAVGVVVKPEFESLIKQSFEQRAIQFPESPLMNLPVYTDNEQTDDCLIFYDAELLKAYLNRRKSQEDAAKYYQEWMRIYGKQIAEIIESEPKAAMIITKGLA